MLVIVAPGQGSQTPGFLAPWLEEPSVRGRVDALAAAASLDLVTHGTTSDAETIKDTAVAQPLIVSAGLATLPLVLEGEDLPRHVSATAGHSVGEITAAAIAGVLTPDDAVGFVRERGLGMAEAAALTPTGMAAVVGGDPDEVAEALERHGLTPANMNGAGQVVAAGTTDQLAALEQDAPHRARVIPLPVAGAFHTHHMQPAADRLTRHAETLRPQDPRIPLLSNADGRVVADGTEVLRRLVAQVAGPVRWDLTMEALIDMGVTGLIELPPAGTLVGLAKRGMRGVETLALRTPDDLEAAARMVREHGTA